MFNFIRALFGRSNQQYPYVKQNNGLRKLGTIVALVFIIALIVAGVYTIYSATKNNPQKISSKFVKYLKEGKTEDAYNLGSPVFQFIEDKNDWNNDALVYKAIFTKEITEGGEKELGDEKFDNPALAYGFEIGGDDYNYEVIVYLEEVESKWRVSKFTVNEKE
jgi:hypothetical protein